MRKCDIKKLDKMRAQLSAMREKLEAMASHYERRYDNASDRWQTSEAGAECDGARDGLETAAADLESAESTIWNLCS